MSPETSLNLTLACFLREQKTARDDSEIASLRRRLDEIYASTSWKVAREVIRPFRRIGRRIATRRT